MAPGSNPPAPRATVFLSLDKIRLDGETQSRASLNLDAVSEYADDLKRGEELPNIVVFFDGSHHWLASGFHRWHAYKRAGRAAIPADVLQGDVAQARLYSASTNAKHGLRRTHADKRRAVHMVLADAAGKTWDAERVAKHCSVSVTLVKAIQQSTPWEPATTLFGDADEADTPPPPDRSQTTPETRLSAGKITVADAAKELEAADRERIEGKVVRLVRKLCRHAKLLGETPAGLLARHESWWCGRCDKQNRPGESRCRHCEHARQVAEAEG